MSFDFLLLEGFKQVKKSLITFFLYDSVRAESPFDFKNPLILSSICFKVYCVTYPSGVLS